MATKKQNANFETYLDDEIAIVHASLDAVVNWIDVHLEPQDVFVEKALRDWAEANGYILRADVQGMQEDDV